MKLDIVFVCYLCGKDTAFFKTKNNFMYFSVKKLRNISFLPVFVINHRFIKDNSVDYQSKSHR